MCQRKHSSRKQHTLRESKGEPLDILRNGERCSNRYPESHRKPELQSPVQKKSLPIIGVSQEWISKSLVHKHTFQSQDEGKANAESDYGQLVRKESSIH